MAIKLSSGLKNMILNGQSVREALDDFVIRIYAGTPPTSADASVSANTLLCTLSLEGANVTQGSRSLPAVYSIAITDSSPGGKTFGFDLVVDNREESHIYTAGSSETKEDVGRRIANILDDIDLISAIYGGLNSSGDAIVLADCRVHGLPMTLSRKASSTGNFTVTQIQEAQRSNTLQFSWPSDGALSKPTGDRWLGTNVASGVASFFRIVRPDDSGGVSTTAIRIQGTVGTSGADMNLTSTAFAVGAVTSIASASFRILDS